MSDTERILSKLQRIEDAQNQLALQVNSVSVILPTSSTFTRCVPSTTGSAGQCSVSAFRSGLVCCNGLAILCVP